jgi:hypothetical protein
MTLQMERAREYQLLARQAFRIVEYYRKANMTARLEFGPVYGTDMYTDTIIKYQQQASRYARMARKEQGIFA